MVAPKSRAWDIHAPHAPDWRLMAWWLRPLRTPPGGRLDWNREARDPAWSSAAASRPQADGDARYRHFARRRPDTSLPAAVASEGEAQRTSGSARIEPNPMASPRDRKRIAPAATRR